jgi:BirA family biotin operon repressor/biotin-[acetyl-CoA-carboxylase] ligase
MTINWILERVAQSTSTNDDLMARWRNNELLDPVARKANLQTHGKGRQGRTWLSSEGRSLTFSVAYPFNQPLSELSGLSLACGLATLMGIRKTIPSNPRNSKQIDLSLKWPNDILLDNAKLAGILIEGGQLQPTDPTWLVIGIGINLEFDSALAKTISQPIAALSELQVNIDIDVLWLNILEELGETLELFAKHGFEFFLSNWNQCHALNNQVCNILENHQIIATGKCLGANAQGQLLLQTPSGVQRIISGDLSLRQAP